MSDIIEIPMTIEKPEIAILGGLKGCLNADTVTLPDGSVCEPATLIWLGFAGRADIERYQWVGVGKLQIIPPGSINKRVDFSTISKHFGNVPPPVTTTPAYPVVPDSDTNNSDVDLAGGGDE